MYESPIYRISGEIYAEMLRKDEEHLMATVNQQVGYQVDKSELIKALRYDRDQYNKGYKDGFIEGSEEWLHDYKRLKELEKRFKRYTMQDDMHLVTIKQIK